MAIARPNVSLAIIPGSVRYYWGRINRDESEDILTRKGIQEGLYLLRESMSQFGHYVISICHENRIYHYSVERNDEGLVSIPGGRKFIGPIELIAYHNKFVAGFITRPSIPCNRDPSDVPMAFKGVPMSVFEKKVLGALKARNIRDSELQLALGPERHKYFSMVAKEQHLEESWYHGFIDRIEAERRISLAGHLDGRFLIRRRDENSYALSLSHHSECKHYKIDVLPNDMYAIEDGKRFSSLIEMIDFFHFKSDGLLCILVESVPYPGYQQKDLNEDDHWDENSMYSAFFGNTRSLTIIRKDVVGGTVQPLMEHGPRGTAVGTKPVSSDHGDKPESPAPVPPKRTDSLLVSSQQAAGRMHNIPDEWGDEPDEVPQMKGARFRQEKEFAHHDPRIYDPLPRSDQMISIRRDRVTLDKKLGSGQFGTVFTGSYLVKKGEKIPVAIKTLKAAPRTDNEGELMKEAKVMVGLNHKHVIRLIGVICDSEVKMIVLELAPLGQLNKYLRRHADTKIPHIVELLYQVAQGMAYLESTNFVHRDLASRNVLLVNPYLAKVSDFGMSRALGMGNEYYKASSVGRWPLKWYAPECIYFHKFDSKSDVWSYGITMWEAFTYGGKPYKGMAGSEIMEMLESGERLLKPQNCPNAAYAIMTDCWEYLREDRPSFKDLVKYMGELTKRMPLKRK